MNKPYETLITVDYRERQSNVCRHLSDNPEVQVEWEQLSTGDYVIDHQIIVERKTCVDFVQSIVDGRLFKQAKRLKSSVERAVLIIEGDNLYSTGLDVTKEAVHGALISISIMWYIPVLFAVDAEETARILSTMLHQWTKHHDEVLPRPGYKPKKTNKRKSYILQGLPNVGPGISKRLLERFKSVKNVICANESELTEIKGIGKVKAKRIREILN